MPTPLKLRGTKLFLDGQEVAEIKGHREWTSWCVVADFSVFVGGEKVATGFCYFRDAVKWARSNVPALLSNTEAGR